MSSLTRKEVLRQLPSWIIRDRYRGAATDAERLRYRAEFLSRRMEGEGNTKKECEAFRVDDVAEWICPAPEIVTEEAAAHGGLLPRDDHRTRSFSPVMITGDEARRQAAAAEAEDAEPVPELRARRVKVTLELPEYLVIAFKAFAEAKARVRIEEYLVDLFDGNTRDAPRGLHNEFDEKTLLKLESKHPGFIEAASWDDGQVNVWPELVRQRIGSEGVTE